MDVCEREGKLGSVSSNPWGGFAYFCRFCGGLSRNVIEFGS